MESSDIACQYGISETDNVRSSQHTLQSSNPVLLIHELQWTRQTATYYFPVSYECFSLSDIEKHSSFTLTQVPPHSVTCSVATNGLIPFVIKCAFPKMSVSELNTQCVSWHGVLQSI